LVKIKDRTGTHPYGRLGGAKAYRKDIIVHNAENFKILSQLHVKNGENTPVRDGLGILRSSAFSRTEVATAVLPLWSRLECGQVKLKK